MFQFLSGYSRGTEKIPHIRLLMRAVNHVLEPVMEMENPLAAIEASQLSFFEEIFVPATWKF